MPFMCGHGRLLCAAGGKATVWIVGAADSGVSTFAAGSSNSGNTLNAYDGETGQLLYQVCTPADIQLPTCLVEFALLVQVLRRKPHHSAHRQF